MRQKKYLGSVITVAGAERRINEEIERLKKALEREEHHLVRRIIEDKIEELERMRSMMGAKE